MLLIASNKVKLKLKKKHDVLFTEVEEAFNNFTGYSLEDKRAEHRTKPPTLWCLSETYDGRLLKIVYIYDQKDNIAYLRTAYEPDENEVDLWNEELNWNRPKN